MYVCMDVCMCACMYVCMYVQHTHTHIERERERGRGGGVGGCIGLAHGDTARGRHPDLFSNKSMSQKLQKL